MLRACAGGALGGALWGVVARVFMRLLSDAPAFSWSGTLVIVGLGTVAGACVGLVHGARAADRTGWWRLAALPGLLLFVGPGALLVPGAIGMALVLRGRPALRVLGALLVVVAPVVLATSSTTAPTPTQVAGLALMVLSTAPLGWAMAEVAGRWRPKGAAAESHTVAAPATATAAMA